MEKTACVRQQPVGPWANVATARSFLAFLAGQAPAPDIFSSDLADQNKVASWLVEQGLGPLAYFHCQEPYPSLAGQLQVDTFSSVAENSLHWQNLEQINIQFSRANVPFVLLKGAALAETVYGGRERRTMSDVDLWLRKRDLALSYSQMSDLGFQFQEKETRPHELQLLSDGELRFYHPDRPRSLVELHLSPFSGWWLKRTTAIDNNGIWSRIEPLNGWDYGFHLSPEDTIIHVAVHLAVNHQFGLSAVRSLMDIALTAEIRGVDWNCVAERAKEWRVATATWLVLLHLQQLIGTSGLDAPLQQLQPSSWRRKYLQQLVSPESILLGADLSSGRIRFLYLLLLVDRVRDMDRLIFRTLWPEPEWLQARYGKNDSRWQHLEHIIRHGQI